MEEKLMVEKLPFNLQNMDPTQKGLIEEGSLRSLTLRRSGAEVVVLDEAPGTGMIIVTGTGMIIVAGVTGEVVAGAGIGMIGTVAGTVVIAIEVGAVAIVQTMIEAVVGAVMTMSDGVGVVLLKVLVLTGAYHHALLLLGIKALLVAALHQNAVFHQTVVLLILGARHPSLLRSD